MRLLSKVFLGFVPMAVYAAVSGVVVRGIDHYPIWSRPSSVVAVVRGHPQIAGVCARLVLESGAPLSIEALARCRSVAVHARMDRSGAGAKEALRQQMHAVARADGQTPLR